MRKLSPSLSRRSFVRRMAALVGANLSWTSVGAGHAATPKPKPKPPAFRGAASTPLGRPAPWQARPFPPATNGSVLHCAASYVGANGVGGGAKHSTMLHCPLNGRMYIFGGDRSGYASDADKAASFASDDFRNDIWSYAAATDNWRCEATWDVPDGQIHPWRPDWGNFAWDSKRNVFWFRSGGSSGGLLGGGSFRFASTNGLTWTYGGGRLMPDPTMVAGGTLTLPDNSVTYFEYDPAAHALSSNQTGFTGGSVIPLYRITTSGGKCLTPPENHRPYWMTYGNYADEPVDCRHYADPTHLICLDVTTMRWTDPGLPRVTDQIPSLALAFADGRLEDNDWRTACMIYDASGDQLVILPGDKQETLHFNLATNTWKNYKGQPKTQLHQARFWFNEADRLIYAIDGAGQFAPYMTTAVAWTYDVDAHAFLQPMPVPDCQYGPNLWAGHGPAVGAPVGGMLAFAMCVGDSANEIVWWPETTNALLCPYGYQNDGLLQKLHAWHYKENRWEVVNAPYDPSNRPHGTIVGFDPSNKLLLIYGQNAGSTDRGSVYYPALNPVNTTPYLYAWTPGGFTKPTWSTMP